MKRTNPLNGQNRLDIPHFVESNIRLGLDRGLIWADVGTEEEPQIISDYDALIKIIQQSFLPEAEKPRIKINYQRPHTIHDYKPEELVVMAEYVNARISLGFPGDRIALETYSNLPKSKKRVDITIYDESGKEDLIEIECKQIFSDLSEAKSQAMDYATTRQAKYVIVSSGDCREFADVSEYDAQKNIFPKIPNIPDVNGIATEDVYSNSPDLGTLRRIVTEGEYRKRLKELKEILKNAGFSANDRYKIVGKLLLCSVLEPQTLAKNKFYEFQTHNKTNLDANYKKITSLYARLRRPFQNIMDAGLQIEEHQAEVLFNAVEKLHDLDLNKSNFNWPYYYHIELYPLVNRKDRDSNQTPDRLVDLGYQTIRPEPTDKFTDICAGYCSFLIGSKRWFAKEYPNYQGVFGNNAECFDIALEILPTAVLSLIYNDFSGQQIKQANTACSEEDFTKRTGLKENSSDCSLSNLPFSEVELILRNKIYLAKPGKLNGIILPGDFLSTDQYENIRNYLFYTCNIPVIYKLYRGVFEDTGVESIYLFYNKKLKPDKKLQSDIFIGDLQNEQDLIDAPEVYYKIKTEQMSESELDSEKYKILRQSEIINNSIHLHEIFNIQDYEAGILSLDEIQNNFKLMIEDFKNEFPDLKKKISAIKEVECISLEKGKHLSKVSKKFIKDLHLLYRRVSWKDIKDGGLIDTSKSRPFTSNLTNMIKIEENLIWLPRMPYLSNAFQPMAVTKDLAEKYKKFAFSGCSIVLKVNNLNLESCQAFFWSDFFFKQAVRLKRGIKAKLIYKNFHKIYMPLLPAEIQPFIIELVRQYKQLAVYKNFLSDETKLKKSILHYKDILQQTINSTYYELSKKMKPLKDVN